MRHCACYLFFKKYSVIDSHSLCVMDLNVTPVSAICHLVQVSFPYFFLIEILASRLL